MMKANVTISQKIKVVRTVEVEAETYDDIITEAKNKFDMCLIEDYDDFDDYNIEYVDIVEESDDENAWYIKRILFVNSKRKI